MKLLSRITIANTVLVIIAMAALSFVQLLVFRQGSDVVMKQTTELVSQSLTNQLEARAKYTANYLSDSLINPMYTYDMEGIYDLLKPALDSEELERVVVFDAKGHTFHTGLRVDPNYGQAVENKQLLHRILNLKKPYSKIDSDFFTYGVPLMIGDELLGGLYLSFSLEIIQEQIHETQVVIQNVKHGAQTEITFGAVGLAVLFSALAIGVSFIVTNSIISPLADLITQTKRISKGELDSVSTEIRRSDELGDLAASFNEMSASLIERRKAIEFLAYHDHLTELPNRTKFTSLVETLLVQRRFNHEPLMILFVDLDDFKAVNDNFGHQAGDRLLIQVANRFRRTIVASRPTYAPSEDVVLSRIGGDEFLICLPECKCEGIVERLIQDLINEIRRPIIIDNEQLVVGGSIGISRYPEDGMTADDLVKCADIAMYHAKTNGKNMYCFFTDEMRDAVLKKSMMERRLHLAMKTMEQFAVWYQPFFDTKTGSLIGAEALLRWNHPEKGTIPPDEFITVAEECGLIVTLGEWVISQVCQQLKSWQDHLGDNFYISVNLSAKQLYGQQVVKAFYNHIEASGIDSSRLHIEVTESLLMSNEREAACSLEQLRSKGMQVWLDDFGTGFSSLNYLRQFKMDGLKIDKSFVRDIETDANDRTLCKTIISLAHDLGLDIVAEGIETQAQLDFLVAEGCRIGQGDLFASAMCSDSFEQRFFIKQVS
ncbi:EAL domain-containing protein [Vibrio sp. SCSIO 43136]|uniref:EAL domain-containing protein n=1 Tax=Vibrio sp. SCSIO 43136 TaxID=2819101 RepID=UPI002075AA9E|nr:EAL domain-containing protein [Vibrio sp. SCSIO 43136]USD67969.1 EAL domain-containing protein [Vibrio sp. SCSIO 43136]